VVGLVLVSLFELRAGRLKIQHWLLGGVIVALPILPWLLHNLLVTGNPLYPYLFATPWMSAERMAEGNLSTAPVTWWIRLLLPLSLTWTGVDSAPEFNTDIGPLLLLFSVFGFWRYWKEHTVRSLALLLLPVGLAISLLGPRYIHLSQTRLYFVLLPVLAAAAGWGWAWMQSQVIEGVRLRRILGTVMVLVIGLAWWSDTRALVIKGPVRLVLGLESRQAYLENNLGWYARAVQGLSNLPPGSQPLMLWEARGLYAPLNVQADPWIDRYRGDLLEVSSASALLERWKSQGITHLLVYDLGLELIRPAAGAPPGLRWTTWQELQHLLPAPTTIGDTYFLYTIQ
jgi:4-amino-4-deoxy-L-arabinose transferase-like glycosyltransferase